MSKRSEIKQKEQLQLQLQAQFNKLDQTVLSWLKPGTNSSTPSSSTSPSANISTEFSNQIVIPSGKGIQFNDDDSNNNDGVTINDFLDTASSISSNRGKKNAMKNNQKIQKIGDLKKNKDNLYSSNSLRALSNKIRNEKRNKFKNLNDEKNNVSNVRKFASDTRTATNVKNKGTTKSKGTTTNSDSDSDSASDDEDSKILKSKLTAKNKTAMKNKRPF